MSHFLLTGSTGLLGGYLLRDLLVGGEQVVVIVRPGRGEDAEARVEAVLQPHERLLGRALPRPLVFAGDLTKPGLGLNRGQIAWLSRNCDRVFHSAASLAFREADGEPRRSNVEGVANLLALCQQAGIRHFYHVSTAYVCGLREGRVFETELDVGQRYANVYEETKAEAERMIRDAAHLDAYTIFRPSIITGDSRTGYTSTFHGIYAPLRVLQALWGVTTAEQAFEVDYLSALGMNGEERKNLVPVDWVSQAIIQIARRQTQVNCTYALTSPNPIPARDILQAFARLLRMHVDGDRTTRGAAANPWSKNGSPPAHLLDSTAFEEKFTEYFAIYESYWRNDPVFDATHADRLLGDLPCPVLDVEALVKLGQFALEANFGYPKARPESAEFRIRQRLERTLTCSLDHVPNQDVFAVIATGPGGGTWTIDAAPDGHWRAVPGISAGTPWIRSRTSVLSAMAADPEGYRKAVRLGRAAVCCETSAEPPFVELLARLASPDDA